MTDYTITVDPVLQTEIITLSYTDERRSLVAKIVPALGSNLYEFSYNGLPIIVSDPTILAKKGFTGTFVLFPTPNRVKEGTYAWEGKTIHQHKQGTPILLHGLVFDEAWNHEAPVKDDASVHVDTWIRIDKQSPLYEAYPFACLLTLTYTLDAQGIHISYAVKNEGDTTLPFGFGLHPYFSKLSGNDKTHIQLPAQQWMEAPSDTLLPTGNLIPLDGQPYDARQLTPVGNLSLDHVYTDIPQNSYTTIRYEKQNLTVTLKTSPEFTHLVVYTKEPETFCIENQTCSTDAINLRALGFTKEAHVLTVEPGQTHRGSIS